MSAWCVWSVEAQLQIIDDALYPGLQVAACRETGWSRRTDGQTHQVQCRFRCADISVLGNQVDHRFQFVVKR